MVYSRLGALSQYALLIDDVGNKDAFYRQLSRMAALGQRPEEGEIDIGGASDAINSQVERLQAIADALYAPDDLGVEPYKLYLLSKRIDLTDDAQRERVQRVRRARDERLLDVPYEPLCAMHSRFSEAALRKAWRRSPIWPKPIPGWRKCARADEYGSLEHAGARNAQAAVQAWNGKTLWCAFSRAAVCASRWKRCSREYFPRKRGGIAERMLPKWMPWRKALSGILNIRRCSRSTSNSAKWSARISRHCSA